MIARLPIHVRVGTEGDVLATPVPFTDLAFAGSSYEACVEALTPVLQDRISSLDPVDRLPLATPPSAAVLRIPVTIQPGSAGGDVIDITIGVVTVDRAVGGRPVTLAYPVAVPGLEVLQKDGDRDKLRDRLAKQLSGRLRSWSAAALVAADEPTDTTVRLLELEVADGGADPDFDFPPSIDAASGVLDELGVDLTRAHSGRIDRREELVLRTLETLAAQGRSSVMLVGPADVGKTALVHEIARRVAAGDVPSALQGLAVWRISANELIAGAQYTGMWQDRVRRLVDQARRTRAVVVMGDPVGIIDAGRWSRSDNNVSRFLRPYVESGEITLICECTLDQFSAGQRKEPSFMDAFHRIDVVEPTREETLSIATDAARRLAQDASIEIGDDAIAASVDLTRRFEPYRSFPGKTIRLLEDAVRERREDTTLLDRAAVTSTFSRRTGMPLGLLSDDVVLRIDEVRRHFESRVLGQPDATETMVEAVTVLKAGLNDPTKPLASFFFVGPTGVGKTELAKALAEFLFGSRDRVIRLDMGEYASGDAVQRLVGTAWGEGEGELTRRVREQPFCVVLLDEIEKAHWSVFDALLAALGEGRLADASGRTADFRNAIVIMTSNLGARRARSASLGFDSGDRKDTADSHYVEEAEKFFRPEFFNRIDRIVVFHELAAHTVQRIARRELEKLLVREGITRRGLRIEIDDAVVDAVAVKGFHPRYGARPLQREIERAVISPLARLLVERSGEAAEFARIHLAGGEIAVSIERAKVAQTKSERRERRAEQADAGFEKAERGAADFSESVAGDMAARDADELRQTISELVAATHEPDFWRDADRARLTLQRVYQLEALVNRFDALAERASGLVEMARRVRESRHRARLGEIAAAVESMSDSLLVLRLELAAATVGAEGGSASLRVVPVGREASRWARQLLGMYRAWADRTGRDAVVSDDEGSPCVEIHGPATLDLLSGEHGLHRHVRPDRTEVLARVTVSPLGAPPRSVDDGGVVVRVYEEGKRRIVRDPRTGARESHVNAVLDDGRLDAFLIAWLRFASDDERARTRVLGSELS